ncbi:MAG: ABC transporter ATP-binding protein, partial [Gammaproteobacteria bacterium]|nr:ABC transporter ATP-binding protein [Gammaproteobacteria bacterium]
MRNFFKQYFYLLDAEARRRLPFLVLMFVVSSVLDVIGIGTVGVFLVMISSPEKILHYLPFASTLQTIPAHSLLLGTGCVVIVAFMLKAWLSCIIQKQVVFFGFRYALKLKLRLMEFYQYAPYSFHLKQNSAYLIDRMNQIDIYVAAFLIPSLMLLSNVLVSVFVVSLLFTVHPFATLALGGVFALIFWISGRVLKNKAREYGRIVSTSAAEINKNVQHALVGLKEVRVFGGEPYFFNRVERQADLFAKAQAMNMFYQLVPRALTEAVLAIFIIVLCLLSLSAGMTTSQIV